MASKSKIAKALRKPKFSTRLVRRCRLCGRPRAVYRKFGICRICFRKLADEGLIPGVRRRVGKRDPTTDDDRPHRRHVDPHPQRGARRTAPRRNAALQGEARTGRSAQARRLHLGLGGSGRPSPAKQLRVHLKYGPNGERVIRHIRRVSKPGRRVYSGADRLEAGARRTGNLDHQHQPRRDQRSRSPAAETGRRSALRSVVDRANAGSLNTPHRCHQQVEGNAMSRIGKKPVVVPGGVKVAVADSTGDGRRPQGQARVEVSAPRSTVDYDERPSSIVIVAAATTTAQAARCTA